MPPPPSSFAALAAFALALALALAPSPALAADPVADRVASLPGWSDPFRSARFAGFLQGADATRHVTYFLAESEGNPATDPLVVWLNGGPGCSSFIGLWLEQGPLVIGGDGLLSENAGRWNQHANVLFIESPPGVGFAYIDKGAASLPYVANDTTTAADSLGALQSFFRAYPQFATSALWLSGESYAGMYVPWLARAILASGDAPLAARLRGVLVGNGALKTADAYEGLLTQQRMQHASNHGLFSSTLRAQIDAACVNWTAPRSAACDALLATQQQQVGPLNAYNIEVTCVGPSASASPQQRALMRSVGVELPEPPAAAAPRLGANACTAADAQVTAYMNRADVQAAFHVAAGAAVVGAWGECQGGTVVYTREPCDETTEVYPILLDAGLAVLIFNGDQDECIPYIQDEAWTLAMGFAVKEEWRPWLLDEQVAGYVREFSAPAAGGRFAFATVKRAGHEVPMYQPARALAMLERFIAGAPL
jgi:carboxypeptidase C (cathepsin A)